jgi:predicted RNase H-like HicB family nuclease
MATLTLEYWIDDGWYVGRLCEVPGCFSQGETLAELEQNIAEVFRLLRADDDMPSPPGALQTPLLIAA